MLQIATFYFLKQHFWGFFSGNSRCPLYEVPLPSGLRENFWHFLNFWGDVKRETWKVKS